MKKRSFNREAVDDIFRAAVLEALDAAARRAFELQPYQQCPGAFDKDLPRLFKAIDVQVETLASRYSVELTEN